MPMLVPKVVAPLEALADELVEVLPAVVEPAVEPLVAPTLAMSPEVPDDVPAVVPLAAAVLLAPLPVLEVLPVLEGVLVPLEVPPVAVEVTLDELGPFAVPVPPVVVSPPDVVPPLAPVVSPSAAVPHWQPTVTSSVKREQRRRMVSRFPISVADGLVPARPAPGLYAPAERVGTDTPPTGERRVTSVTNEACTPRKTSELINTAKVSRFSSALAASCSRR